MKEKIISKEEIDKTEIILNHEEKKQKKNWKIKKK